jgi:hypothetical protein
MSKIRINKGIMTPHFESCTMNLQQAQNASSWQKCGNSNKTNNLTRKGFREGFHGCAMFHALCHVLSLTQQPRLLCTAIRQPQLSRIIIPTFTIQMLVVTVCPYISLTRDTLNYGRQNLGSYILSHNTTILLFLL